MPEFRDRILRSFYDWEKHRSPWFKRVWLSYLLFLLTILAVSIAYLRLF